MFLHIDQTFGSWRKTGKKPQEVFEVFLFVFFLFVCFLGEQLERTLKWSESDSVIHYSDYIRQSLTHIHTRTYIFAGWWTSSQADRDDEMTCTILLLCLEMHIFDNNTFRRPLYSYRRRCRHEHWWVQLLNVHTLVSAKMINHRRIFLSFFFLKERRLKRAYGARETLYQKWKGAGHHKWRKENNGLIVLVHQKKWRLGDPS